MTPGFLRNPPENLFLAQKTPGRSPEVPTLPVNKVRKQRWMQEKTSQGQLD